jgi:hypothetical protein
MLEDIRQGDSWIERVNLTEDPFGHGNSREWIVSVIGNLEQVYSKNDASIPGARKEEDDSP